MKQEKFQFFFSELREGIKLGFLTWSWLQGKEKILLLYNLRGGEMSVEVKSGET